jgi:hypothetical protein
MARGLEMCLDWWASWEVSPKPCRSMVLLAMSWSRTQWLAVVTPGVLHLQWCTPSGSGWLRRPGVLWMIRPWARPMIRGNSWQRWRTDDGVEEDRRRVVRSSSSQVMLRESFNWMAVTYTSPLTRYKSWQARYTFYRRSIVVVNISLKIQGLLRGFSPKY